MKMTGEMTVKSGGEFLKDKPDLKIGLIAYELVPNKIAIAFERPVNDLELTKMQVKELIKNLTDLL